MIQCPICQMLNEDQTRFCAECGARLGPTPAPGQQAPPTNQQSPQAKLHSPILGNAGAPEAQFANPNQIQARPDAAEMDRLRKIGNRPDVPQTDGVPRNPFDPRNQAQNQNGPDQNAAAAHQSQEKPAKKLRSPLLAGDEDYEDDEPGPGPLSSRARMGNENPTASGRQHLHSPLLGDAVAHDPQPMHPAGTGGRPLHSPLLGDAAGHGQIEPGHQSGKHLHSPLLGDAGSHGVHQESQPQPGKRPHLHSPLLGGGDDDDYYENEPAPNTRSGLHSPILGGGSHGGGGKGLRSPMLGGATSDPYYDDDYDDDPYADEDNPNILRSPLLSAKMPMEHDHQPQAPREPRSKPHPGVAGAPPGFYQNAASQQNPQQASPQTHAQYNQANPQSAQGQYGQPQAGHYSQPNPAQPIPQPPVSQQQAQIPPSSPAQGPAWAPQAPEAPAFVPNQAAAPNQIQPAYTQPGPTQPVPAQPVPAQPVPAQPVPAQPGPPQPGPAPAVSPQDQAQAPGQEGVEEAFPDMTQFRREQAQAQAQALNPTPVVPISLPIIPDPVSYIPPELAPAPQAETPSFIPNIAQAPQDQAIKPQPASSQAQNGSASSRTEPEPPPSKPFKRSSSKLLQDDYEADEVADFGQPGRNLTNFSQAQASSPIPKMMGAIAIFLALLKLPLLLTYLPAIANPQYTWQTVDMAATTFALMALGLAALMSKN